ncbi:olfactory receptor 6C75-like [Carettochelys insculpta]|uniref:olfactory receptor 6C75-like n=1 Tax=Carettochelys insculpta TaxID=44489 RepID=UPI003EB9B5D7
MEKAEGRNHTPITEFILLGFGNDPELQPLLFLIFLTVYLVALAGNLCVIALVVADQQLHTPMYYLLGNLAFLESCYASTILPRYLTSLLTGDRTISVKGCIVQVYFFGVMSTAENLLLTAMSYDRYVAICHPLHYAALLYGTVCIKLVAGCWISSLLLCTIVDIFVFQLTFCDSKEIDHFFCAFVPMLQLSCSDTQIVQLLGFILAVLGTLVPLVLTLVSYACIITTILKIPSATGRKKAFSTCSSHLIVVTVHNTTVIAVYLVPIVNTSIEQQKIFSVFCTFLNPVINPVIYCLRNKEVKESLRKALLKLVAFRNRHSI